MTLAAFRANRYPHAGTPAGARHDEAWRMVAVFRAGDSAPKEEFVPHLAGFDGYGGSSALDAVICRYKDANTAWTSASDGTLEERVYLLQNWRGDVSAVVGSDGKMKEWVKYQPYGTPIALPAGDADSDGDCDSSDITQIQTWIDAPAYDVRGDLDLDGDVDATDKSIAQGTYQGVTLGFGKLSNLGNRRGYAGYERDRGIPHLWHVRHRVYSSELGRWGRRDPWTRALPVSYYPYADSAPVVSIDPSGLTTIFGGSGGGGRVGGPTGPMINPQGFPPGSDGPGGWLPVFGEALQYEVETEETCCSNIARTHQKFDGFVGCCNGFATPCLGLGFEHSGPAVQFCALLHETYHILNSHTNSNACSLSDPEPKVLEWNPNMDVDDKKAAEAEASKVEAACLMTSLSSCHDHACQAEIMNRLNQVAQFYQQQVGGSGHVLPFPESSSSHR